MSFLTPLKLPTCNNAISVCKGALYFILVLFCFLVDFVIPQKGESLLAAYDKWRKWADEKGTVVLCSHANISQLVKKMCLQRACSKPVNKL